MKRTPANRRRPAVNITLGRASRLHHLVLLLAERPRTRETILVDLAIGLRTFYRELDLLKRCGVKIRHKEKAYTLTSTAAEAEGRLPFPDPQLSFAEMAELAAHPGDAAKRLAQMLANVTAHATPKRTSRAKKSPKVKGE